MNDIFEFDLIEKLTIACHNNDLEFIKQFLNMPNKENQHLALLTAFNYAVSSLSNLEIIEYLINKGANPNWPNPGRADPDLLEKGVSCGNYFHFVIDIQSEAYQYRINECTTDLLELFLKYGTEINKYDDEGRTPLDLAFMFGHSPAEKFFRKNNAKFSKRILFDEYKFKFPDRNLENEEYIETEYSDEFMNTYLPDIHSLIKYSMQNYLNGFGILTLGNIENSVNNSTINELDLKNRTPLDFAIEFKHKPAEDFLRLKGAKTSKELLI